MLYPTELRPHFESTPSMVIGRRSDLQELIDSLRTFYGAVHLEKLSSSY